MVEANTVQYLAYVSRFKKDYREISRVLSFKKSFDIYKWYWHEIFDIFSETLQYIFLILHGDKGQNCEHLEQLLGFKKDNPGISRGLYIKFEGLYIFSEMLQGIFIYILLHDRGQHFATSGRCITERIHF